MIITLYSVW